MPIIVPVEENQEKIAGLTDARFKAADYGGSGLAALGAGLTRLGEGGGQLATALDEKRKRELAAAVAAAKLDVQKRTGYDKKGKPIYIWIDPIDWMRGQQ